MFMSNKVIEPRNSSRLTNPAELHEWSEKDVVAYTWFWVLLGVTCAILILTLIWTWMYNRQRHETGCPCRKCNSCYHERNTWISETNHNRHASMRRHNGSDPEAQALVGSAEKDSLEPSASHRPIGFAFNHYSESPVRTNQSSHGAGISNQQNPDPENATTPSCSPTAPIKTPTEMENRIKRYDFEMKTVNSESFQEVAPEVEKSEIENNQLPPKREDDLGYKHLHELLTRNLVRLDSIETDDEEIKLARKNCVEYMREVVWALEARDPSAGIDVTAERKDESDVPCYENPSFPNISQDENKATDTTLKAGAANIRIPMDSQVSHGQRTDTKSRGRQERQVNFDEEQEVFEEE